MPWTECMFKGAHDGNMDGRSQAYLRSRDFPSWFTMTTGPKGSYPEHDIIAFLSKHLEPWRQGRHWHIVLAHDYTACKSEHVFQLCWSRGYILRTIRAWLKRLTRTLTSMCDVIMVTRSAHS